MNEFNGPSPVAGALDAVQAFVREHGRVRVRGGGSKPALSCAVPGEATLDVAGLAGVLDYDPREYTLTALAGTSIAALQSTLRAHGQVLPFDPPFGPRGATLGGTVAAGVSGPGRLRYGGIRDCVLGVRFVDGEARSVWGGARVVKNAAGFDFPKLMVGALGRLGVLVELTIKVLPGPEASATLRLERASIGEALDTIAEILKHAWDLAALDLVPGADGRTQIDVRLAGRTRALRARCDRLRHLTGSGTILEGPDDERAWESARELRWVPPGAALAYVPVTLAGVAAIEAALTGSQTPRRYSSGGQTAWLAWEGEVGVLDARLVTLGLPGLVLDGPAGRPFLGRHATNAFGERVKRALDPGNRFGWWT